MSSAYYCWLHACPLLQYCKYNNVCICLKIEEPILKTVDISTEYCSETWMTSESPVREAGQNCLEVPGKKIPLWNWTLLLEELDLLSWICQTHLHALVCRCSPVPQELCWLQISWTDDLDETLCTLTFLCQPSLSAVLFHVLPFKHLLLTLLFPPGYTAEGRDFLSPHTSLPPLELLVDSPGEMFEQQPSGASAFGPYISPVQCCSQWRLFCGAAPQAPAIPAMIWILPVTQGPAGRERNSYSETELQTQLSALSLFGMPLSHHLPARQVVSHWDSLPVKSHLWDKLLFPLLLHGGGILKGVGRDLLFLTWKH